MKKTLCAVFCAAVTLIGGRALAYQMMSVNQPLDKAVYSRHYPKLIVAGHILRIDIKPHPPAFGDYPADVSSRFKVASVIGRTEAPGADSPHRSNVFRLAHHIAHISGRRPMRACASD